MGLIVSCYISFQLMLDGRPNKWSGEVRGEVVRGAGEERLVVDFSEYAAKAIRPYVKGRKWSLEQETVRSMRGNDCLYVNPPKEWLDSEPVQDVVNSEHGESK